MNVLFPNNKLLVIRGLHQLMTCDSRLMTIAIFTFKEI